MNPIESEQAWAERWRRAGAALAEVRARDLETLSDSAALAAAEDLLSVSDASDLPDRRRTWSGLVEWQRTVHRSR